MSKTGYIYKIFCKTDDELVYYGSTTQRVCDRISNHNANYKSWKKGTYHFVSSYLVIETDDWDYMTIEKVVYDEPFEFKNRERFWIVNNECVNRTIPNNTQKESSKIYRTKNKVKIAERVKVYNTKNKVKIAEKAKKYIADNKDELAEKRRNKITHCVCGGIIRGYEHKRHEKSRRHTKYIASCAEDYNKPAETGRNKINHCVCGSIIQGYECGLKIHENTTKHKKYIASLNS